MTRTIAVTLALAAAGLLACSPVRADDEDFPLCVIRAGEAMLPGGRGRFETKQQGQGRHPAQARADG